MLRIERVAITHPHAVALVEEVQLEYVERYGGRDDTPLDGTEFTDPHGRFFVGYVDDLPATSGAWRWRPVPPGATGIRAAELKRMYVVPAHRGRGLARAMLAHLEVDAAGAGADVIVLETGLMQPEALALYESSGYIAIPPFGHYAWSPENRCFGKPLRSRRDDGPAPG